MICSWQLLTCAGCSDPRETGIASTTEGSRDVATRCVGMAIVSTIRYTLVNVCQAMLERKSKKETATFICAHLPINTKKVNSKGWRIFSTSPAWWIPTELWSKVEFVKVKKSEVRYRNIYLRKKMSKNVSFSVPSSVWNLCSSCN